MSLPSRILASAVATTVAAALCCNLAGAQVARVATVPSRQTVRTTLDVVEASVGDLSAMMASGRVTSAQLVDAYLARIAAYDHAGPSLNTLIRINPKARAEAAALDAERRAGRVRGSLHGIPVIIKDNYDTHDMPTSGGSLALANSQPARDAFVVKRLRDAGAVILAKSNMHELAAGITNIGSLGGQTRNPYDPARCPGGSSGGTGAAIAASFAAVGWGSDTCGSIRIPSAYGSLFGLRPTQGMVSRTGIIPLSHTQDIGGPLARTAMDLAVALDVTVGIDADDSTTRVLADRPLPRFEASLDRNALRTTRIGIFRPFFQDTDAEIADTVRAAVAAMRAAGATVVEVAVPEFDTLIANTAVTNMETKFDLANYLRTVPNAPVRTLREIIDAGLFDRALEARFQMIDTVSAPTSEAHTRALSRRVLLRARIERIMDSLSLDVLAYPTIRQKPVLAGETQTGSTCNLAAQSGLPAISIPAGFSAEGHPIGLELLGRSFSDTRLVSIAYAFEATGARRKAPYTTPALVNGRVPAAWGGNSFVVRAGSSQATATGRFTFDATFGVLHWNAALAGSRPDDATAVVLRRVNMNGAASGPAGSTRVVARLLGPGMRAATGSIPLNATERLALQEGRFRLAVYGRNGGILGSVVTRPASPSRR
ncbi:MAG TPA: amidase family protein [Gemmatimonas sp.]|nr:amidase family protein [Gemmatimonas sp.]